MVYKALKDPELTPIGSIGFLRHDLTLSRLTGAGLLGYAVYISLEWI